TTERDLLVDDADDGPVGQLAHGAGPDVVERAGRHLDRPRSAGRDELVDGELDRPAGGVGRSASRRIAPGERDGERAGRYAGDDPGVAAPANHLPSAPSRLPAAVDA